MLAGEVERHADLGVIVDETVHAYEFGIGRLASSGSTSERSRQNPESMALFGGSHEIETTGGIEPATIATARAGHRRPARRRAVPRLQATCSGPPTDSPSGWPRCQRSPGRMKPPTSSPSTSSARLQAPPRAQRTRLAPRTEPSASAFVCGPSRVHRLLAPSSEPSTAAEQNRWFSETATKSRQQQSQRRSPKVRVTPKRSLSDDALGTSRRSLVPVARIKLLRAAATGLFHKESSRVFHDRQSGGEIIQGGAPITKRSVCASLERGTQSARCCGYSNGYWGGIARRCTAWFDFRLD